MNSSKPLNIDLGYADPFLQPWRSKCKYFPSKIGGKPAFLSLNPVLGPADVKCAKCDSILKFILQIYAPVETNDNAFHRTLFLFGCVKGCAESFVVFRNQLAKDNSFYSSDPPPCDDGAEQEANTDYDPNPEALGVKICAVCGIQAPQQCAECKKVNYCSRDHQVIHWKSGHKEACQQASSESSISSNTLFLESELVIEQEDDGDKSDDDDEDDEEDITESEMFKYKEFLSQNRPSMQNENMDEYGKEKPDETTAFDEEEQKIFENFKKRASNCQIVRYRSDWFDDAMDSSEDILWISNKNKPKSIPDCEQCNSKRKFEFQVMPHLLNVLLLDNTQRTDNIDWGTLLIFSCPNSCDSPQGPAYVREFVHNQPVG